MPIPQLTCRVCDGALRTILDLGRLRLNTFPASADDAARLPTSPLVLTVCSACGLVQLDRTVTPDLLFREYWYRSGVNESMVKELETIVYQAGHFVDFAPEDMVLDIGANDGTLLAHYGKLWGTYQLTTVGVDPSISNFAALSRAANVAIQDYFPTRNLANTRPGRFKIITAIACAYDLQDPVGFFREIARLLDPKGVAVVQFQDLGQMLEQNAFDNICHEHLEYYTLHSLGQILERVGLLAERVEQTPINGGSLRVLIRHQGYGFRSGVTVDRQLSLERAQGLSTDRLAGGDLSALDLFRLRVQRAIGQLKRLIDATYRSNAILDIYGASTKGNILLQLAAVGPEIARQAIDRSAPKHGRCTATGIPIVGEEAARADPAQIWLVPIWQYRDFMLQREAWYLARGGRMIFPLPTVEIVAQDWEQPVRVEG